MHFQSKEYSNLIQKLKQSSYWVSESKTTKIDITNKQPYLALPNQILLINNEMRANFNRYCSHIHFGLIQLPNPSSRLILVGGFYGINTHHLFVELGLIILSFQKKNRTFQSILHEGDEYISNSIINIFKNFFTHHKISQNKSILLSIQQAKLYEQALLQKKYSDIEYIYCHRQKIDRFAVQLDRRTKSITISAFERQKYLKKLHELLTSPYPQAAQNCIQELLSIDSLAACFLLEGLLREGEFFIRSRIKQKRNDLFAQCINQYLTEFWSSLDIKEEPIIQILRSVSMISQKQCQECCKERQRRDKFKSNQQQQHDIDIMISKWPLLNHIYQKVCFKSFGMVLGFFVESLSFPTVYRKQECNERQYYLPLSKPKKITLNQFQSLQCECNFSEQYGIPCPHEIYVSLRNLQKISIDRWIIE